MSRTDTGLKKANPPKPAVQSPAGRRWPWVVLLLTLAFIAVVRIRILQVPLERDEGEFAYVGQLMLQGVLPFDKAYIIKLPGTYAAYALAMAVFGQTTAGIHLGLLVVNAIAVVLLFLVGKQAFDERAGVIAAVTYALMSLSAGPLGFAAHATQFVAAAALGGVLLLLRGFSSGGIAAYFGSGMLFGLAFLFKQPGLLFGLFGGLVLVVRELRPRPASAIPGAKRIAAYSLGLVFPFALMSLVLWRAGLIQRFWLWTFSLAGERRARDPVDLFFGACKHFAPDVLLWGLAALAVPVIIATRFPPGKKPVLLGFVAASFLAVCPGLYFHPHYWIVAFPSVGLLIGVAIAELQKRLARFPVRTAVPVAAFAVACIYAIVAERAYLFRLTPDQICAKYYSGNPFREAVAVADYINKNSTATSTVAVLGSEAEIYFYSRRRSATGHVSTYLLMESPKARALQQEMIREIEEAKPDYLVFCSTRISIGRHPYSDDTLFNWSETYSRNYYRPVGVAAQKEGNPYYLWNDEILPLKSFPEDGFVVLKRLSATASGAAPLSQ